MSLLPLILQIIQLLLSVVHRQLVKADKDREALVDAKFKQAVSDGDFEYAAYLLELRNKQLRRAAEARNNNPPGQ